MALAENLARVNYKLGECPVKIIYDGLEDADKAAFDLAIKNKISTNALLVALQKEGIAISWTPINRHLNEICKCYK